MSEYVSDDGEIDLVLSGSPSLKIHLTDLKNYHPEDDYNAQDDVVKAVIQAKALILHE